MQPPCPAIVGKVQRGPYRGGVQHRGDGDVPRWRTLAAGAGAMQQWEWELRELLALVSWSRDHCRCWCCRSRGDRRRGGKSSERDSALKLLQRQATRCRWAAKRDVLDGC